MAGDVLDQLKHPLCPMHSKDNQPMWENFGIQFKAIQCSGRGSAEHCGGLYHVKVRKEAGG